MTMRRHAFSILALYVSASVFASTALAQRKITTTMLPVSVESVPARAGNMLKISADASNQSTSAVWLSFNLEAIPSQCTTISRATLRLVGKPARPDAEEANPQLVKLYVPPLGDDSIGQWSALPGESVFSVTSERLRQAVKSAVQPTQHSKTLKLKLSSGSRLSDWDYYGLSDTAFRSSFKPRLIVGCELPERWQAYSQTTTRSPTHFLSNSSGVVVKPFHQELKFVSNPGFDEGHMFIFGEPTTAAKTSLYEFAPGGFQMWSQAIQHPPGSHELIREVDAWYPFSPGNVEGKNTPVLVNLYSVGNNRIVRYELRHFKGLALKTASVDDLKIEVPPTLGADGSLYFVRSGHGYVYGVNPDLQELWRYPAEEGAGATTHSRITLSPEGERYAYLLTQRKSENKLVRIDTSDGSTTTIALSGKWTGFHCPLVVKGPEQDYVIVAAYSHDDGTLSVYSGGELLWQKQGTVSQPIMDRAGERVFAIQKGRLYEYNLLNGVAVCTSAESDLEGDSNPVLDADNNLYVWNNGTLVGYRNNCERFSTQRLELPKTLELLFAPDGALYARTATDQLFSITPSRPN